MDDNGMAMTSDVIAAADWILANKGTYNIKVANFSLQSTLAGSFMYDPLNKAVEKLWFSGVVVVAAAGNYGENGQPTTVAYAPATIRSIISVGASDTNGTGWTSTDDTAAPWSAFGYTLDGFAKPDLGAPAASWSAGAFHFHDAAGASRTASRHPATCGCPERRSPPPVVSGAAALILAKNPTWTPDKVKGALMLSARPTAAGMALGVGEVNAKGAFDVTNPPNPNLGLNAFVGPTAPAARSSTRPAGRIRPPRTPPGTRRAGTAPRGPTQAGRTLPGTRPAGRMPPGRRPVGPRPPGTLPVGQPPPGPLRAGTRPAGQPLPGQPRRSPRPSGR
jgi:hypothetical protein